MRPSRKHNRPQSDESNTARPCDFEGCDKPGEFRAPKNPKKLRDFYWFCLEHVREYNKAWDYYKGMSPGEIEKSRTEDITWERPTWPLGKKQASSPKPRMQINDLFGFGGLGEGPSQKAPELPQDVRKAMAVLGLEYPFTPASLKKAYKALVKKHHPDLQHQDKKADDMIKRINHAYSTLGKFLKDE